MSDLNNDNRLEQLSRKAADAYTAPGEASWEKMEAALDKVMPVEEKKRRPFIFWWLFPLLLLVGAGILYTVWPEPAVTSSPKMASTKNKTDQPEQNTSITTEQKPDNNTAITKENIAHVNSDKVSNTATVVAPVTKKQKDISTAALAVTFNPGSIQVTGKNTAQLKEATTKQATKQTITAVVPTIEPAATNNAIAVNSIHPTIDSGNKPASDRIIEKTDTAIQAPLTDTLETRNDSVKKEKTKESRFSFALLAGMDVSTVKFTYANKSGMNAGLILGYHFNEKWSLHTGIIYTKKNYALAGEDFHAPKNSWVANYKLTKVEGFCNMWELPLLVRYQFKSGSKRSFFASSGISSYFMTRENYDYSYYWNGQPVTRNSNYPNGNTHLLSILRLSAGWRKNIGPGTSVLVEPYAALPLTGVGFGSIRLSSFGLNFSLQLRQPSEKK
jgi:hypothetical protein